MCRASGARYHLSIFPSAYALGYLVAAPPALFEVSRRMLIAPCFGSCNHCEAVAWADTNVLPDTATQEQL
jgi:hypothetical protein